MEINSSVLKKTNAGNDLERSAMHLFGARQEKTLQDHSIYIYIVTKLVSQFETQFALHHCEHLLYGFTCSYRTPRKDCQSFRLKVSTYLVGRLSRGWVNSLSARTVRICVVLQGALGSAKCPPP